MKTILLTLVALWAAGSSLQAQTLRWTLDAGALPSSQGGLRTEPHQVHSNPQGSLGLVLKFEHEVISDVRVPAFFVMWVSQRGKLLKKVEFSDEPRFLDVSIVHVSDTMLLIKIETPTNSILRKYQARANGITQNDTVLNAGDSVLFGDNSVNRDTQGFSVFSRDENGTLTGIRRYTLR